jgi:hypothetical protein
MCADHQHACLYLSTSSPVDTVARHPGQGITPGCMPQLCHCWLAQRALLRDESSLTSTARLKASAGVRGYAVLAAACVCALCCTCLPRRAGHPFACAAFARKGRRHCVVCSCVRLKHPHMYLQNTQVVSEPPEVDRQHRCMQACRLGGPRRSHHTPGKLLPLLSNMIKQAR